MNADFSEIRRLLESYYDGSLSPEGMTELRRRLADAPSLPPDLEKESQLLQAIDSVVPDPPAELKHRLEKAIDDAAAAKDTSRRSGIILRIAAITVAAAACMSGVFFLSDMIDDFSPSADPVLISQADLSDTLDLPRHVASDYVETSEPEAQAMACEAVTEQPVAPAEKKSQPKQTRKKRRGAHVITDPDEALAYIEATFNKIADDVKAGDRILETALTEGTYCSFLLNE